MHELVLRDGEYYALYGQLSQGVYLGLFALSLVLPVQVAANLYNRGAPVTLSKRATCWLPLTATSIRHRPPRWPPNTRRPA